MKAIPLLSSQRSLPTRILNFFFFFLWRYPWVWHANHTFSNPYEKEWNGMEWQMVNQLYPIYWCSSLGVRKDKDNFSWLVPQSRGLLRYLPAFFTYKRKSPSISRFNLSQASCTIFQQITEKCLQYLLTF